MIKNQTVPSVLVGKLFFLHVDESFFKFIFPRVRPRISKSERKKKLNKIEKCKHIERRLYYLILIVKPKGDNSSPNCDRNYNN